MISTRLKLSISSFALIFSMHARAQVINTVAGTGVYGYTGDGGPALAAQLGPRAVAADAAGNIYIAEQGYNTIRKVSATGVITTIAGNPWLSGYSGDLGPATMAILNTPFSIAVDAAGNIYLADMHNHAVRKINTAGIITTIAGNGTYGYTGDGGAATAANITGPSALALDASGNVYIAEPGNHVVRKVSPSGIITTFAGNGMPGGTGDGGPATAATLDAPVGLAADASGNVYVSDRINDKIRKISPSGIITTYAGNGADGFSGDGAAAVSASMSDPEGIVVDGSGNLYIADYNNNRIRKVDPSGIITTFAGNGVLGDSGDGGSPTAAAIGSPLNMAVTGSGTFYLVGKLTPVIRRIGSPLGVGQHIVANNKCMVYPNPGNGTFTISGDFRSSTGNASLSIVNLLGRVVYTTNVTLNNGTINEKVSPCTKLPNGIYMLSITSGTDSYHTSFIVE